MSSASATATGAIITADNGQVLTITPAGSGAWAIGSTTISANEPYTLPDSQVFSAGSTALNLDGTPITTSALGPVPASATTGIAVLTDGNNTVTAYQVPGNTALGVVNGSTLSYRGPGVSASDGEVVSMVWNGIAGSATTALFSSLAGGVVSVPTLGSASTSSSTASSVSSSSTKASSASGSSSSSASNSSSTSSSSSVSSTASIITTTSTDAAGSAVTSTIVITPSTPNAPSAPSTSSSAASTASSMEGSTVTSTAVVAGSSSTEGPATSSQTSGTSEASSSARASTGLQSEGATTRPTRPVLWLIVLGCAMVFTLRT